VEPAVGGKAKAAVISTIARWLDVPRSRVSIRVGRFARTKVVEVTGDVELLSPDILL
jgi:uncharacterized protein YggU (UPF0235/DUF167 family)